jgi:chaperone BCS1
MIFSLFRRRPNGIQVYRRDGNRWVRGPIQTRRNKDSLILSDDITESVLDDIKIFQSSKQWYVDRSIPYRRSLLFQGIVGSGKSTLAGVCAGEFGLGIATLLFSDPGLDDVVFRSLLDSLPSNAILLIEDIDTAFEHRLPSDAKIGITLEGLLNALDGIGCRNGRILIMTTNYPDRLDPALVRPGRVDRRVEFGYATREMISRQFLWFYKGHSVGSTRLAVLAERYAATVPEGAHVTPARVQEHLLRFRNDPETAFYQAEINGIVIEHLLNEPEKEPSVPVVPSAAVMPPNGQETTGIAELRQALTDVKGWGV